MHEQVTARSAADDVRLLVGAVGLAELQRSTTCSAPEPAAFRARLRRSTAAGISVVEWQSTELRGELDGPLLRALTLVQVQAGNLRLQHDRGRTDVPSGRICCLPRSRFHFRASDGVRLRSVRLPLEAVPQRLSPSAPPVLMESTALVRLLGQSLDVFAKQRMAATAPSEFLAQGLRAVVLAAAEECGGYGAGSADDLRAHIVRYVDARLSDRDLTPASIAAAFGVSLRWVHKAFDRDGSTLALFIRERRVEAVADEIRPDPQGARTQQLAVAFGFSGREHLNRAFRVRYGMTVNEFRERVLHGAAEPEDAGGAAADRRPTAGSRRAEGTAEGAPTRTARYAAASSG